MVLLVGAFYNTPGYHKVPSIKTKRVLPCNLTFSLINKLCETDLTHPKDRTILLHASSRERGCCGFETKEGNLQKQSRVSDDLVEITFYTASMRFLWS